jgi:hypothetical protein
LGQSAQPSPPRPHRLTLRDVTAAGTTKVEIAQDVAKACAKVWKNLAPVEKDADADAVVVSDIVGEGEEVAVGEAADEVEALAEVIADVGAVLREAVGVLLEDFDALPLREPLVDVETELEPEGEDVAEDEAELEPVEEADAVAVAEAEAVLVTEGVGLRVELDETETVLEGEAVAVEEAVDDLVTVVVGLTVALVEAETVLDEEAVDVADAEEVLVTVDVGLTVELEETEAVLEGSAVDVDVAVEDMETVAELVGVSDTSAESEAAVRGEGDAVADAVADEVADTVEGGTYWVPESLIFVSDKMIFVHDPLASCHVAALPLFAPAVLVLIEKIGCE